MKWIGPFSHPKVDLEVLEVGLPPLGSTHDAFHAPRAATQPVSQFPRGFPSFSCAIVQPFSFPRPSFPLQINPGQKEHICTWGFFYPRGLPGKQGQRLQHLLFVELSPSLPLNNPTCALGASFSFSQSRGPLQEAPPTSPPRLAPGARPRPFSRARGHGGGGRLGQLRGRQHHRGGHGAEAPPGFHLLMFFCSCFVFSFFPLLVLKGIYRTTGNMLVLAGGLNQMEAGHRHLAAAEGEEATEATGKPQGSVE